MASQGVPVFMNNPLQGTVFTERAKFRVLDQKSGKRFIVKIKEKRPKWYQLCFNWWLRKLNIKKRDYENRPPLGEPDQDSMVYETVHVLNPADDRESRHSDECYSNFSPTLSHQSQEAETEVVVHVSRDASGSDTHSYYNPSSSSEDIYGAPEPTTMGKEPEGYQPLYCTPGKVKPLLSSQKEKVEDAVDEIVREAPENEDDLSKNKDDCYARHVLRYKELACLSCELSLESDSLR